MKVCVGLTFIAAVLFLQVAEAAVSDNKDLGLDTAVRKLLNNFMRIMPCGLEQLHIPVLAPVYVQHHEFDRNNSFLNASGHISNFYITGLDSLQILGLDFNTTTKRFAYDLMFKEIQLLADYKLNNSVRLDNFSIQLAGEGVINNKFSDLRFVGEFVLAPARINRNGLRIENFDLKFLLADAVVNNFNSEWDNALNNFINKFTSEGILMWVQQVQKRINGYFNKYLLDNTNKKLANISEKALVKKLNDYNMLLGSVVCTKA